MSSPEPTGRDALVAAIEELRQRIATVHERQACPACRKPIGRRCRRLVGYGQAERPPLKHPHSERLRADGIPER